MMPSLKHKLAARQRHISKRIKWRRQLAKEQGGLCYYCEEPMTWKDREKRPTLDHRMPLARGGADRLGNCVAACFSCNQAKGSMTLDEIAALDIPEAAE